MKKIYDVYFTLAQPAVIAIEANSEDEAMEKLQSMDGNELLRRIQNAIDFMGVEPLFVDEIDEVGQ